LYSLENSAVSCFEYTYEGLEQHIVSECPYCLLFWIYI